MTLQQEILPWSLCGPSHIPPLLLSSSKGFREIEVDCGGCVYPWNVLSLECGQHPHSYPPNSRPSAQTHCNYWQVLPDFGQDIGRTTDGLERFFDVLTTPIYPEKKR